MDCAYASSHAAAVTLAHAFLSALPAEAQARFAPEARLEATLAALSAGAAGAWPAVAVPADAYVRHLAERAESLEQLAELDAAGLWLACACARGDAAAVRLFDQTYRADVARVLGRIGVAGMLDEVAAGVLAMLFVGSPPGIAAFRGTGELRAWVRVVALREAYRVLREQRKSERREVSESDEGRLERAMGSHDPELDHLKVAYRAQFKRAFEQAFHDLPARDRTLLRYHLLDGLKLEQIGIVYDVSRATAARWLAQARATLLELTRRRMGEALGFGHHELDSVMALIKSDLDVSITRLLRGGG
jgi:RNA polymerase sigma-70 factor, ECF subfamily